MAGIIYPSSFLLNPHLHINISYLKSRVMDFIIVMKFRNKVSKEALSRLNAIFEKPPPGFKPHGLYFTLGRYDAIWHVEADDQLTVTEVVVSLSDICSTETFPAIPREEFTKRFG